MPTPRVNFAVAAYKNRIYVVGGTKGFAPTVEAFALPIVTGANEAYDPATDTWETKTPMPTPRQLLQANTVGDKIYLIGGIEQEPLNDLLPTGPYYSNLNEVYDPSTDSWTLMSPLPIRVSSYVSATVDDKIYVMGNMNETYDAYTDTWTFSSLNQIYDAKADTWTLGKPLLTPVVLAGAGATTGSLAPKRIYVIGGCPAWSGPEFYHGINSTQVYDAQDDSWTIGADLPTRRRELAVAMVNDTLYAMGGTSGDDTLATVEQYVPIGYKTPSVPSSTETSVNVEPFSVMLLVATAIVIAVVASLGVLVYFKKLKH